MAKLRHDLHLHHHRMEAALKVDQPVALLAQGDVLISTR
jgi:hypothetical protein